MSFCSAKALYVAASPSIESVGKPVFLFIYENSSRGKDSQRKNNGGNSRENIDAVRDGNSRPRLRYNRFFGNERCLKFRLHTVTLILHHLKIKNYLNCV